MKNKCEAENLHKGSTYTTHTCGEFCRFSLSILAPAAEVKRVKLKL